MDFALHVSPEIMGVNMNTKLNMPSTLVNDLGCDLGFISLPHTQSPQGRMLCKGATMLMLMTV